MNPPIRDAEGSRGTSDSGPPTAKWASCSWRRPICDAAESCYLNAQTRRPRRLALAVLPRPYLQVKGPLAKAVTSFERALQLKPDDVATLVWLGEAISRRAAPRPAAPLFARALALQPDSAAARFGAGRAALARKDHAAAVRYLEEALAREPAATAIHYPLAMAYRGLGDLRTGGSASREAGRHRSPTGRSADARSWTICCRARRRYNVRGGRELDAGNWARSGRGLPQGARALLPTTRRCAIGWGRRWRRWENTRRRRRSSNASCKHRQPFARAYFSLGVIDNDNGQYEKAIDRFSAALKHEPGYVQARVQLAGALARSGRLQEALDQYAGRSRSTRPCPRRRSATR